MKKWIVLTTLLLSACTPQVTVTSEVIVTSTPLPTQTHIIPTTTATPEIIEMTDGDKLIWNAAPEKVDNVEGAIKRFYPEWGVVYEKDGEIVGLWEYNTYNYDNGHIREAKLVNGKLIFLNLRGDEVIKYPEVLLVDFHGQPTKIYTTARNYQLNPMLETSDDYLEMLNIFIQAYEQGLIPSFAEDAITISDFVMSPANFKPDAEAKRVFEISYKDYMSRKFKGDNKQPYSPAVFPMKYSGKAVNIAIVFPVLIKEKTGRISGWWGVGVTENEYLITKKISKLQRVQDFLDGGKFSRGGNSMSFPDEFRSVDICQRGIDDLAYREFCVVFQENQSKIRRAFSQSITNGVVVGDLMDGSLLVRSHMFQVAY